MTAERWKSIAGQGHGSVSKYSGGCRCSACKQAHAEYDRTRRHEREAESEVVEMHTDAGTRHKFGPVLYTADWLGRKWFRRALCNYKYIADEVAQRFPEKRRCLRCFPS